MLERYRKTMSGEVLHSWTSDAQNKIDELTEIIKNLTASNNEVMAKLCAESYQQGLKDGRKIP